MQSKITLVIFFLACSVLSYNPVWSQERKKGSEIYEQVRDLEPEERERVILKELLSGNFPEFLLGWQKITTRQKDASGNSRKLSLFVSPDYVSVGNKKDYFIIPLRPNFAQKFADKHNASLPTPKVSDLIYQHARLKLEPFNYIPRGTRNESTDIFYDHSRVIQAQMKAAGFPPGTFIAGTKKDMVISTKLTDPTRPRHVSIYGWHKLNGKPIQPLYNGHINTYVDYSHGARLISNRVLIDGDEFNYREILKDENLYKLLSDEDQPLEKSTY